MAVSLKENNWLFITDKTSRQQLRFANIVDSSSSWEQGDETILGEKYKNVALNTFCKKHIFFCEKLAKLRLLLFSKNATAL
jgi:hypothetical protein